MSPANSIHSPSSSYAHLVSHLQQASLREKHLKPFKTGDFKILLLENVNQTGRDILQGQGYQVEFHKSSLPEDELIEKIR